MAEIVHPAPSNYVPGAVKEEVVSPIDLTPTTLGFAGIEKPLRHARAHFSR